MKKGQPTGNVAGSFRSFIGPSHLGQRERSGESNTQALLSKVAGLYLIGIFTLAWQTELPEKVVLGSRYPVADFQGRWIKAPVALSRLLLPVAVFSGRMPPLNIPLTAYRGRE